MESALSPPRLGLWSALPLLSVQCPQPYLTCGGRSGGSRVKPQCQGSGVVDTPPTCPQPHHARCGACPAFAALEPGLGSCQFSGTGVRMASFQRLGEPERQRHGSVKPALRFLSLYLSVSSKMIEVLLGPQVPSAGGQPSGVRPRAQVTLSLRHRLRPPSSAVQSSVSGYWGCWLPLRPLLDPWGRLEVHWARSSDLALFIFFLLGCGVSSSALARPSSFCTNFSTASSFPGGGGDTLCAARAPIGQAGRGGVRPPRLEVARRGTRPAGGRGSGLCGAHRTARGRCQRLPQLR